MKIELKNIKFSETFSEETNCFKANVYADGKLIGEAENDGHGGSTFIRHADGKRLELQSAEAYAKALPKVTYGEHSWDNSLEWVVDMLLEEWLKDKHAKAQEKRRIKDYTKGIVYKDVKGVEWTISWKGKPIPTLLGSVKGTEAIKAQITKLQGLGHTIMNTNLGELVK